MKTTREPSEVLRRAERLVKALEAVFDSDWDYTMSQLGIDRERQRRAEAELLRLLGESIPPSEPEGTFLKPSDPSSAGDNWGNYCDLLEAYADLRAVVSSPAAADAPRSLRRAREELDELYDELMAAEGSFMLQLRNGTWHQGAFRRFVRVTHAYLEARDADASIPRWIAEGLWTLEHLASDWLHNSPPGSDRERRYRDRVEAVHLLSGWLFTGVKRKTFDLEGSG